MNLRRSLRTFWWQAAAFLADVGVGLAVLVAIAVPVAIVYVIGHFIIKFW